MGEEAVIAHRDQVEWPTIRKQRARQKTNPDTSLSGVQGQSQQTSSQPASQPTSNRPARQRGQHRLLGR